jgi:4-amino-4-deoxy-L-arabinose transferase-like glycosyltransferase
MSVTGASARRALHQRLARLEPITSRPWLAPLALAWLCLGMGLGSSGRLTYHEAIVAQGAREMLAGGDWLVPTLGGVPWLEKPPLLHWLVAGMGLVFGGIDEWVARLPSAVAAGLLALGVARMGTLGFGPTIGRVAGLVQLTTSWTVVRGRLCESDMLLACLVTGTMAAFAGISRGGGENRISRRDAESAEARGEEERASENSSPRVSALLASLRDIRFFFALLGMTALAKGIGFGGALILATIAVVLVWNRDAATFRRLLDPAGWLLAGLIALAWPLSVLKVQPDALSVWALHVADRFAARSSHFAGEPLGGYLLSPLLQTLPWTPLALAGAWRSWRRAKTERLGPDRLLWAWAVVPAVIVSLASARNAHYLIYALPPWSIWATLGLVRIGERLAGRGYRPEAIHRLAVLLFAAIGLGCGLGYAWLGPRFDHRGREWSWYAEVSRRLETGEPLVLLYDDWDRVPYPTPFGPVPHDLAVRLFYLDRPNVTWHRGPESLRPPAAHFAVIARQRDLPALRRFGRVEEIVRGPEGRWDRAYGLWLVRAAGPDPDTRFSR